MRECELGKFRLVLWLRNPKGGSALTVPLLRLAGQRRCSHERGLMKNAAVSTQKAGHREMVGDVNP
jgi:hypothetical protein